MDIIEQARILGKAIQQDERYIRYAKATLQNESNEELQEAIREFNLIRMQLDNKLSADEKDEEAVAELNEKLRSVYASIMSNNTMVEYNTAKVELDQLMSQVNIIISKSLDGEDPETCETTSGCGGSCATCCPCFWVRMQMLASKN